MSFRVFVGNLPRGYTDDKFIADLKAIGISGYKEANLIINKKTNKPFDFGFLIYEKEEDAKKAIAAAKDKKIGEKKLRVEMAYDEKKAEEMRKLRSGKVFVGNLSPNTKEDDIKKIFEGFKVVDCKVVLDGEGKCKGIAFANFESKDAAEKAIESVKGTKVDGQIIKVEFARRRRFKGGKRSGKGGKRFRKNSRKSAKPRVADSERVADALVVYVGNISFKAESKNLSEFFAEYKPKEARIARAKYGRSLGFGFVDFNDAESAKKALELNDKEFMGRKVKCAIAFKKIEPKEKEKN